MKNKLTYITREDEGIGVGKFDSIKWAFEMYKLPDNKEAKYGVIVGSEDSPIEIRLFTKEPNYTDSADIILKQSLLVSPFSTGGAKDGFRRQPGATPKRKRSR